MKNNDQYSRILFFGKNIKRKLQTIYLFFTNLIHKKNKFENKPELNSFSKANFLECDILVQVENFTAGGLENIVLDLNEVLIESGYKLVFLILGFAGEGVNRARNKGMNVIGRGRLYHLWSPGVYHSWSPYVYHLWPPYVYHLWSPDVYHAWSPDVYQIVE